MNRPLPPINRLATRMDHIAPFHVMALLERAQQLEQAGRDVIHLEIGEPDFPTPPQVIAAGQQALANGHTRYSAALGLPALREAIAGFYADRFGVQIDPRRIVVTAGASGALLLALGALVSPGDRVLLTDPGYPCNRHFVSLLEGEPVNVPVGPDSRYQLLPEHVAAHAEGLAATLVASPANPTGTVLSLDELRALKAACDAANSALIVDEIYQGLVFDTPAETALSVSDDLVVVNSFSKYFQMTGWRLGWLVVPEAYLEAVTRLAQNVFIAASTPAQHAALAAFRPDTLALLEERRQELATRRDSLLPALGSLGLRIGSTPQGAFYVYADCSQVTEDSEALARRLLEETYVAITPGLDFGEYRAREHLRIAFTVPTPRLMQAVERLASVLRG